MEHGTFSLKQHFTLKQAVRMCAYCPSNNSMCYLFTLFTSSFFQPLTGSSFFIR